MKIAVVCCSLNPTSRSAAMAQHLRQPLADAGAQIDWIDLREHPLPPCDGGSAYAHPTVSALAGRLSAAQAAVIALPIYNYGVNAAAKNLIELAGRSLTDKPVGLVCSAGGQASYMSVMGFATGLMLDFRCWIVPRFVFAHDNDFDASTAPTQAVIHRIEALGLETVRAATALGNASSL